MHPALLSNVRHLDMVAEDLKSQTWRAFWSMLPLCKGLLSITLSDGGQVSSLTSSLAEHRYDTLSSVTVRQFSDLRSSPAAKGSSSVSRLRVCEPSDIWYSPSTILASFGFARQLSHLQLSRRVNGNEENDLIFVQEVKQILLDMPGIKKLVVSLFPSTWAVDDVESDVEESNIWDILQGVDERLVVAKGTYDEWMTAPWDRI